MDNNQSNKTGLYITISVVAVVFIIVILLINQSDNNDTENQTANNTAQTDNSNQPVSSNTSQIPDVNSLDFYLSIVNQLADCQDNPFFDNEPHQSQACDTLYNNSDGHLTLWIVDKVLDDPNQPICEYTDTSGHILRPTMTLKGDRDFCIMSTEAFGSSDIDGLAREKQVLDEFANAMKSIDSRIDVGVVWYEKQN